MAAAGAGKHILCEKPMCTTLAEADEILAAVGRSGVTYMSAHNQLFTPVVREAKRLLDEGLIGHPPLAPDAGLLTFRGRSVDARDLAGQRRLARRRRTH